MYLSGHRTETGIKNQFKMTVWNNILSRREDILVWTLAWMAVACSLAKLCWDNWSPNYWLCHLVINTLENICNKSQWCTKHEDSRCLSKSYTKPIILKGNIIVIFTSVLQYILAGVIRVQGHASLLLSTNMCFEITCMFALPKQRLVLNPSFLMAASHVVLNRRIVTCEKMQNTSL